MNLVGDIGPGLGSTGEEKGRTIPAKAPEEVKPQKEIQKKTHPTPTREKDTRSLAPKKTEKEKPQSTTKDDLKSVEKRIRQLKQRVGTYDVATAEKRHPCNPSSPVVEEPEDASRTLPLPVVWKVSGKR